MRKTTLLSIILLYVISALLFNCSLSYAKTSRLDKMIKEIESKLPIAEKQAELIIKMFNNDKHLVKIQNDIDKMKDRNSERNFKVSDTYIYSVFKRLKVPMGKTAISGKYLMVDFKDHNCIQVLDPELIAGIVFGTISSGIRTETIKNKSLRTDKNSAEKLASIVEKLLSIQKPVQLLAREKLDISGLKCPDCSFTGCSGTRACIAYAFLFPDKDVKIYDYSLKRDLIPDAHVSFLKSLKTASEYFDEIGYGLNYGRGDWSELIEIVDDTLSQLAETDDLDDLILSDGDSDSKQKLKDDDLSLDDLKLPSE